MYESIVAGFLEAINPKEAERRRKRHREWCLNQLVHAEPWSEDIRWRNPLVIKADSYKLRSFFPVRPHKADDVNYALSKQTAVSPCKRWCYAEKILPRGVDLPVAHGRDRGIVIFDGDVRIPVLYERDRLSTNRWDPHPWMGLTPSEMLTLRPGTRKAKGRTIIAGLGLGHQLIEVSHKKTVKEIVLVENSRGLVRWLLPKIKPFMGDKKLEVVIGDAYEVMPKMEADVALVDIFPRYGGNEHVRDGLRKECSGIGHIWAWGCNAWR